MTGNTNHYFTATGPGHNGFYTDAARLQYGVNVQGTTAGVYGEALQDSPLSRAAPAGTGVCGVGDNAGVIGQSMPLIGVDAQGNAIFPGNSSPPPPATFLPPGDTPDSTPDQLEPIPTTPLNYGTGVGVVGYGTLVGTFGQGYLFGVQGVSPYNDKSPTVSFGTGVQGMSAQGVGVLGVSQGVTDLESGDTVVAPYIGVFGSAQSADSPRSPYPIVGGDFERVLGSGVVGVGANYGGVFQANPELDPTLGGVSPTFGNLQLTPIPVPEAPPGASIAPFVSKAPSVLPWLPLAGQPGDIVTLFRGGQTQVWVCLARAPSNMSQGATWARVNFDFVCVMPPGP